MEPVMNMSRPSSRNSFRPYLSPRVPPRRIVLPKTIMYAEFIQMSWADVVFRAFEIVGRATFSIVPSMLIMMSGRHIAASAHQRFGYGPVSVDPVAIRSLYSTYSGILPERNLCG